MFEYQVGMIETNDNASPASGFVVVDVTPETVTTVSYKIPFGTDTAIVDRLWQRQRGVDSMPRISGYTDMETAGAVRDFFIERGIAEPEAFVAFCTGGHFGKGYRERTGR